MKFVRIEMLFLIWVVPILLLVFIYGFQRRKKILKTFAHGKAWNSIIPNVSSKRRWIKASLILGCLLFLSIAISGFQYGFKWQEIERKGIDIVIALDCSKSMMATDISPTRLDRAKREVFDLLGMLEGDRIGLVAFSGSAFLQCPLTMDYEAFYLFLNTLTPEYLPVGGTDIAAAIDTSISAFDAQTNSEKAIILITDGESTGDAPIDAAQKSQKKDIKIFSIGVGKAEGVPIPDEKGGFKKDKAGKIVLTKLDEHTLKKIAAITNGSYVRSIAGDMDLDSIYNEQIRKTMERQTLSSSRKQIWADRFQWFLGIALLLGLIELFMPSFKKGLMMLFFIGFTVCIGPINSEAASMHKSLEAGLKAYQNQDYESALKSFIEAQLEAPDKPEIYYNIANTQYKLGQFDEAYDNYLNALNVAPAQMKPQIYYNMGNTQFRKKDFEKSIANYKAALKLNPNDDAAKKNLEFVKKVKEQQPPPQNKEENQDDQKKDDQQKKDQEKKDQEKKNDQQQKSEDQKQKGEQQKKQEQNQENEKQEQKQPDQREESKEKQEQKNSTPQPNEQQAAKNSDQADKDQADKDQAARMLNRLEDKPGKAMMPAYQELSIEKDW